MKESPREPRRRGAERGKPQSEKKQHLHKLKKKFPGHGADDDEGGIGHPEGRGEHMKEERSEDGRGNL